MLNFLSVMVDPQKFEAIKNYIFPNSTTQDRSFVGLASYYRWFVKNFTSIITQLTNLTEMKVLFEWTKKCEEDFQNFKTILTTANIQALPVEGKDLIIYIDASHSSLDVVLIQHKKCYSLYTDSIKGI